MHHLAPGQHADELLDAGLPGLRGLRVLDPIQDGVAVRAGERGEEVLRSGVGVERSLQVQRDCGPALRRVRAVPAAVGAGDIDLRQSGGRDPAFCHQSRHRRPVHFGPSALRRPGREADQPVRVVVSVELAVDPPWHITTSIASCLPTLG